MICYAFLLLTRRGPGSKKSSDGRNAVLLATGAKWDDPADRKGKIFLRKNSDIMEEAESDEGLYDFLDENDFESSGEDACDDSETENFVEDEVDASLRKLHVAVVVQGDLGRSPRMQFHAASLCSDDRVKTVSVVGLEGESCYEQLEKFARNGSNDGLQPKLKKCLMSPQTFGKIYLRRAGERSRFLFAALSPIRAFIQALQLFWILAVVVEGPLDVILVQNPPSIPTLAICVLVSRLRGARFVVDWHNLGFSVLAMRFGGNAQHWMCRAARLYEKIFSSFADAGFCVTMAMREWLQREFGVRSDSLHVLYDKPPASFRRLDAKERRELLGRLDLDIGKGERLVISSTSWTPDEDFSILLDAVVAYEKASSKKDSNLPKLHFVITGKGPQKAMYLERIAKLNLKRTTIRALWLEASDYPKLLGAADLGVCLHTSTSGIDLPMKVVDMFGSGLPVCAVNFRCLGELVVDGENGRTFDDADQLALQFIALFGGGDDELRKLRNGATKKGSERWREQWLKVAAPVILVPQSRRKRWGTMSLFVVVFLLLWRWFCSA